MDSNGNFIPRYRRELSIPQSANAILGTSTSYDSCRMYDVDYAQVIEQGLKPESSWTTVPCRNGWDYDYEQTRYPTIVSEVFH